MAPPRKTTNTTRATSAPSAAKGDTTPVGSTKESEAKLEDAKTDALKADESKTEAVKEAELKLAEAKVDELKDEQGGVLDADQVESKIVRNPELDGGVDKVAEGQKENAEIQESEVTKAEARHNKEQRERFLTEGIPTSEAWDDPNVNIAELPANFDPVVVASHEQASHAAEVDNGKLIASTAVQISQFDNSTFGTNVLNSLSHTAEAVVKDDEKDSKKK